MKSFDEVKGLCHGVKILGSEDQKHSYSKQDLHPGFLFMSRNSQTLSEETLLGIFSNSFLCVCVCVNVMTIVQNVQFPSKAR